jgi:ubiquinone/menaquinone biosynthesis C-methylase UbiE
MNWHTRYSQQAQWTRDLRDYIFEKIDLNEAQHVLEVGCGTGAILSELPNTSSKYGLDIDPAALAECHVNAPDAFLIRGNALQLPYPGNSFDIVYSHFLLLWVGDPLQALLEMKRVARSDGYVIAFAEPDYSSRIDEPRELIPLGRWQTEALARQGADPSLGARLAELFFQAEIPIVETGTIQGQSNEPSSEEWELEWAVIEADLMGWHADADIQNMKRLDRQARERGIRRLHVPTHFAWGRV